MVCRLVGTGLNILVLDMNDLKREWLLKIYCSLFSDWNFIYVNIKYGAFVLFLH